MAERDTSDYMTAFAVGALLGVGAALLLRPRRKSRTRRVLDEIEPYRKRVVKRARRAGKTLDEGREAALERGGALADAGRQVLERFREELVEMAAQAQHEVDAMIGERLSAARKQVKRRAKKVRG